MLFVQGRREIPVLPAVSTILLNHSAVDILPDSCVVSIGQMGSYVSAGSTAVL